jgi:hypothetical protein
MSSGLRPGRALTESVLPLASTQGVDSKEVIVSRADMLNSSVKSPIEPMISWLGKNGIHGPENPL